MQINLYQLEAFAETAEKGSFSAASRSLGKAQSAVSTAVMNLEIDLGVTLFDRTGKYPVLTPQGEGLLRDARRILAQGRDFVEKAEGLSQGIESRLTLVLDEATPWDFVVSLLGSFGEAFPHVDLEFLNASLRDADRMVKSGRADIGVLAPLEIPPLEKNMRLVGNIKFLPAVSLKHPLADLESVTLPDLLPHRQLLVTSRSGEREEAEFVIGRYAWWVESPYAMRDMIRAGLGWGFLPEFMVLEDDRSGHLKQLSLEAVKSEIYAPLVLTWTLARPLGPAGKYLIKALGSIK